MRYITSGNWSLTQSVPKSKKPPLSANKFGVVEVPEWEHQNKQKLVTICMEIDWEEWKKEQTKIRKNPARKKRKKQVSLANMTMAASLWAEYGDRVAGAAKAGLTVKTFSNYLSAARREGLAPKAI